MAAPPLPIPPDKGGGVTEQTNQTTHGEQPRKRSRGQQLDALEGNIHTLAGTLKQKPNPPGTLAKRISMQDRGGPLVANCAQSSAMAMAAPAQHSVRP